MRRCLRRFVVYPATVLIGFGGGMVLTNWIADRPLQHNVLLVAGAAFLGYALGVYDGAREVKRQKPD